MIRPEGRGGMLRPTEGYPEKVPPPSFWGRPTWAEIDLIALRGNLHRLRRRLPRRVKILFVVKADGYGHGAAACARTLAATGMIRWLGVSSVEEGLGLRGAGIRLPILILGSLYPFESFRVAAEHGLTPTLASLEAARRLLEARRLSGRPVHGHIKIETGMNRIGVRPAEGLKVAQFLVREGLGIGGVYTHFSSADTDPQFTRRQLSSFSEALRLMTAAGLRPGLRHAANSAAAVGHPASRLDMVRPGLALYGLHPGFEPVLSLKSRLIFIKNVARGTPIGYGAAFRTRRPSRIATIPVGYADGLPRGLSNRGEGLVRGRRCPIVGMISMDMAMLDVTDAPLSRVGDEVVLIGRQGRERIGAVDIAGLLGTVPYEVVARISARVPRVYST